MVCAVYIGFKEREVVGEQTEIMYDIYDILKKHIEKGLDNGTLKVDSPEFAILYHYMAEIQDEFFIVGEQK